MFKRDKSCISLKWKNLAPPPNLGWELFLHYVLKTNKYMHLFKRKKISLFCMENACTWLWGKKIPRENHATFPPFVLAIKFLSPEATNITNFLSVLQKYSCITNTYLYFVAIYVSGSILNILLCNLLCPLFISCNYSTTLHH